MMRTIILIIIVVINNIFMTYVLTFFYFWIILLENVFSKVQMPMKAGAVRHILASFNELMKINAGWILGVLHMLQLVGIWAFGDGYVPCGRYGRSVIVNCFKMLMRFECSDLWRCSFVGKAAFQILEFIP